MLYNYRHGLELALKVAIADAASCNRSFVRGNDPRWSETEVGKRLATTHAIDKLVEELHLVLATLEGLGADNMRLDPDTLEVLDSLQRVDRGGEAFRYTTTKVGRGDKMKLVPIRSGGYEAVDVVGVAQALRDAAELVIGGVGGILQAYEEWRCEMAEYAAEAGD